MIHSQFLRISKKYIYDPLYNLRLVDMQHDSAHLQHSLAVLRIISRVHRAIPGFSELLFQRFFARFQNGAYRLFACGCVFVIKKKKKRGYNKTLIFEYTVECIQRCEYDNKKGVYSYILRYYCKIYHYTIYTFPFMAKYNQHFFFLFF